MREFGPEWNPAVAGPLIPAWMRSSYHKAFSPETRFVAFAMMREGQPTWDILSVCNIRRQTLATWIRDAVITGVLERKHLDSLVMKDFPEDVRKAIAGWEANNEALVPVPPVVESPPDASLPPKDSSTPSLEALAKANGLQEETGRLIVALAGKAGRSHRDVATYLGIKPQKVFHFLRRANELSLVPEKLPDAPSYLVSISDVVEWLSSVANGVADPANQKGSVEASSELRRQVLELAKDGLTTTGSISRYLRIPLWKVERWVGDAVGRGEIRQVGGERVVGAAYVESSRNNGVELPDESELVPVSPQLSEKERRRAIIPDFLVETVRSRSTDVVQTEIVNHPPRVEVADPPIVLPLVVPTEPVVTTSVAPGGAEPCLVGLSVRNSEGFFFSFSLASDEVDLGMVRKIRNLLVRYAWSGDVLLTFDSEQSWRKLRALCEDASSSALRKLDVVTNA